MHILPLINKTMKKVLIIISFFTLVLGLVFFLSSALQSCKKPDDKSDTARVYKPNIYIYPKHTIDLKVNVSFPKGGKIVTSIPAYNNNWNVNVDSTGKIDNKYDYLFYESDQPDEWQYKTGWVVEKENLLTFFQNNMTSYGFNQKEIKDFTDFWIPKFVTYKYYLVYPQEKAIIDKLIKIDFSIKPDNSLRLFYAITGTNEVFAIDIHKINSNFKRNDFCVTEWGVIIN